MGACSGEWDPGRISRLASVRRRARNRNPDSAATERAANDFDTDPALSTGARGVLKAIVLHRRTRRAPQFGGFA
jgi:hypothetical protein